MAEEKTNTGADGKATGGPDMKGPVDKKVDETWKQEASLEKERLEKKLEKEAEERRQRDLPPASFLAFISGFAAQVLIHLGEMENPISDKLETDLAAAKYSIDTLSILREKTKGNLTTEEERYFDAMLTDLRMRYVRVKEKGPTKPKPYEAEEA